MNYLRKESVKYIILHCSDTKLSQQIDAKTIDVWHQNRGFEMIGYHYFIDQNGVVEHGRPLFYQGAHVRAYNNVSIGVCLEGGRNEDGTSGDTRTGQQKIALLTLLRSLKERFPNATIIGHRDLNRGKVCPCFDAKVYNTIV